MNSTQKNLMPVFLLSLFLWSSPLLAAPADLQNPQTGAPIAESAEKSPGSSIPVSVISEGKDSLGARLVMRLKERFNQSSLFRLENDSEKDSPRLVLMLITESEFADRPAIGSVYSICWVFKQGKGYLPFLLRHSAGVVSAENMDALMDRLLELTDGVASRYAHLLKK